MQTEEFLLLSDFLNARYTNSEIVICDPRRLLSRTRGAARPTQRGRQKAARQEPNGFVFTP